ncbi:MAG: hypothetical protein JO113_03525, partial [Candidatus Eremiobacteraeota bacterium]|nr:hypothetical protein [Candidatus Eremiobacteraeota bacterium]
VGKTRCALQAGAELLEEFGDGVWLIDLAPIADASLVTSTIAATLGVRDVPNRSLLETLIEYLASRKLLLILDNCEHVLDEARRVTAEILKRCRQIRMLATSREPFNVGGEQVLRLPSLQVADAIALFTDRAHSADSHFSLTSENTGAVTAIATRLDGMPLAIELAAARVRVLSPAQIAQRLDERFRVLTGGDRSALPRRQTLRATIDWSHDMLDDRERVIFRRLAIFAGGFGTPAAISVCSVPDEIDEWDVLDSLTALVDKSLVLAEPYGEDQRYRLLQSMREYGLERLREAGEEQATAGRHARYYASFVASLRPLIEALEDEQWGRLCRTELDNIRTAIEWTLVRRNDPPLGIALLAELEWPQILTTPQEAMRWYERAAQETDAMPNALAHARILRSCVLLEWLLGHPHEQRQRIALHAVEVAKAANDADEIARALANLGGLYRGAALFDEAEVALAEAYAHPDRLSRITANVVLRIWAVNNLQRGDVELARLQFSTVAQSERPGSEAHASALLNLGELEYATGNLEAARAAARRAKETYAALGSTYLDLVLANLGAYALAAGDLDDAGAHLREALEVQRRLRGGWLSAILEHHALLAALRGDQARAALLLGFTDAQYRVRGEVRQSTEQRGYERLIDLLGQRYANGELESLTSAGARLSEEEALDTATAIYEANTVSP